MSVLRMTSNETVELSLDASALFLLSQKRDIWCLLDRNSEGFRKPLHDVLDVGPKAQGFERCEGESFVTRLSLYLYH